MLPVCVGSVKDLIWRQHFRYRPLAPLYLGLFRSDILLILIMVWPCNFSAGQQFLSVFSPLIATTPWYDFWIFAYCPLALVLHVTLANPVTLGFEFHQWGHYRHAAFSGRSVRQPVASLYAAYYTDPTPCWRDPTRSLFRKKPGCNFWLSLWTLSSGTVETIWKR